MAAERWDVVIDVRDLARWLVAAPGQGISGIFNVMGETVKLADHLEVARAVGGHSGPVVAAAGDWLSAHGVRPWAGDRSLPLWIGDPAWLGFGARSAARARGEGLATRSLEQTLADTLAWETDRDLGGARHAGLSDDDERSLLDELAPTT